MRRHRCIIVIRIRRRIVRLRDRQNIMRRQTNICSADRRKYDRDSLGMIADSAPAQQCQASRSETFLPRAWHHCSASDSATMRAEETCARAPGIFHVAGETCAGAPGKFLRTPNDSGRSEIICGRGPGNISGAPGNSRDVVKDFPARAPAILQRSRNNYSARIIKSCALAGRNFSPPPKKILPRIGAAQPRGAKLFYILSKSRNKLSANALQIQPLTAEQTPCKPKTVPKFKRPAERPINMACIT